MVNLCLFRYLWNWLALSEVLVTYTCDALRHLLDVHALMPRMRWYVLHK